MSDIAGRRIVDHCSDDSTVRRLTLDQGSDDKCHMPNGRCQIQSVVGRRGIGQAGVPSEDVDGRSSGRRKDRGRSTVGVGSTEHGVPYQPVASCEPTQQWQISILFLHFWCRSRPRLCLSGAHPLLLIVQCAARRTQARQAIRDDLRIPEAARRVALKLPTHSTTTRRGHHGRISQ